MGGNPRYRNGNRRRKYRARLMARGDRCGICGGEIRYDQPSDAAHPWSFVVDEIWPVSRWKEFGYDSAAQAAQDWNNLQAAHYACNAAKGAKTSFRLAPRVNEQSNPSDGNW